LIAFLLREVFRTEGGVEKFKVECGKGKKKILRRGHRGAEGTEKKKRILLAQNRSEVQTSSLLSE
jgi:hypothetical protein